MTFRINPSHQNHEKIIEILRDPEFVSKFTKKSEKDVFDKLSLNYKVPEPALPLRMLSIDQNDIKIDCKTYYPGNLVFEIPNVSKDLLKKNP